MWLIVLQIYEKGINIIKALFDELAEIKDELDAKGNIKG